MPINPMPEQSNEQLDQRAVEELVTEVELALAAAYLRLNKLYHGTVGTPAFDAFAHAYNLVGITRYMVRNAPAIAPLPPTPPETR